MSDLITISSSGIPDSARVLAFRGTEAISRPYELEIFLSLQQELGDELDLADGIGAKARLTIDRGALRQPAHTFVGILADLEIVHAFDGRILLRGLMVPRLWQLGLSRHSRIFTKMAVPDIIKAVLTENGVTDFEMRLGPYEKEEHVSQYRESDLDFVSRWMEREGIYYFFEHLEEGEKLVLCDSRLYDKDEIGAPVRYFPQASHDRSAGQHLRTFKCRHAMRPASVRLKDYDYAKPGLNVSGTAAVASNGTGEVSLYGERFFTPAAGDRLAKIRAEEMLTRQVLFRAAGTRHNLRPGYTFELDEHPIAGFNADYLTVEARHSGNQAAHDPHLSALMGIEGDEVYSVEIDAIPAKTQFRAESKTAWPRIYGVENGVVDGPADSDYAQMDDQGRYLCKFKYDESKLKNGKATTWVRMMQPHGGDIEGFHFPLRKGTEVVFSFLGGDVDRPVISGVVPNALNPSPVTAQNHTKNVIQTGARNRLEIEDKAGNEWIRLSTPYAATFINMGLAWPQHELHMSTQDSAALVAQKACDIAVGLPEPAPAGPGNMTVHVQKNLTTTVDKENMATTVSLGDETHEVSTGKFTELVQSDVLQTYNATKTEHVDNGQVTETYKAQNTEIATTQWVTTGDQMNIWSKGQHTVHSDASYFHTIKGTTSLQTTGNTDIGTTGPTHIHSTADITIDTPANITIQGNDVKATALGHWEGFHGSSANVTLGFTFDGKLAAAASITAGAYIDVTAALKLAIEASLALTLNFGVAIANKAIQLNVIGFKMKQHSAEVATNLNKIAGGALHIDMRGLHMKA